MNTTELIEIAEDVADDCIESYCGMYYQFHRDTLQQFAQRIEQPLQLKINELNFDIAHQQRQIEQLREALGLLLDCAIHGYDMPEDHSYAIISRKAMEQTK